jgi:tetratricopeptide (TPR) repeat protein
MCRTYVVTSSLTINIYICIVPPPKPLGRFAEGLRLFDKFLEESDLDAARQCVDISGEELNANAPAPHSDAAAFLDEINDAGQSTGVQRRYHILIQLACTLHERYQYAGDACDLNNAAMYGEEALSLCRAEKIVCPTVWVLYADILRIGFETTTSFGELRKAEILCREAMSLCAAAHPLSSKICNALSWIYLRYFSQRGGEAVIDEAVYLQRLGLERLPETEYHNRHRHLLGLVMVLMHKYLYAGHQDTDDVLSIASEALQICPPMHVDKWMANTLMMVQLFIKYIRSRELEFLDRSIELGHRALNTGYCPNPLRRVGFVSQMAESLRARYERAGTNDKDLVESIELKREALQIITPSHTIRWTCLNGLASALIMQFQSDGDVSHLEEASQLYHHSSNIMSTANPWRPDTISGYAHSLSLRFKETGDIAELNRAIDLDKQAVNAMCPSAVNYANSTLQMVSHLCLRWEVLHETSDLAKATTMAEELLRSLPDGNINRLESIIILAKTRLLYAMNQSSLGDIELSIEQLLSIKEELSQSNLGPDSLRTLAACYMTKFRHSSAADAAIHAKDAIDEVLKNVDSNHYERFQCLIDAAKLYMEHGTPYHDIDTALKHLSDALENSHRDVRSKIRGAKDVLDKMEIDHHDIFTTTSSTSLKLLDITEIAVLLLPRVAFFGIHPYSRLQSLKQGQTIAMIGASHALNLFLPEKALEIMEHGRAIFWTHTLRLRSTFHDIPKDLRDRLTTIARRLEKVANSSENSMDQHYIDQQIVQRRKQSDEFNLIVEKVRRLPGLERFMLPDQYLTLKGVAERGPVVVLVSSTLACHAIILKSSEAATRIPLKAVTDKWLVESSSVWRSTVLEARSELRNERKLVKTKKVLNSAYTRAERILRLLWIDVVFPIIRALQIEVRLRVLYLGYQNSHQDI